MAITVTHEWWTGPDHVTFANLLQLFTSGSAGSFVPGFWGAGTQCISLPVNLRKDGPAPTGNFLGHVRARYDQDGIPVRLRNGTNTGPYIQVTSGAITVRQSDGTLIGTASFTWQTGFHYSLSFAFQLATNATGRVKLWINDNAVLDLTNVQTTPSGGAATAVALELDGFGLFRDTGFILGSGSWVDADVPLRKRCFTGKPNAAGTFQQYTPQGTGSTHVDRVNELLGNGDTNSVDGLPSGTEEGFFMDPLPGNVGTIWGVQHDVQARQLEPSVPRGFQFRVRNAGGNSAFTAIPMFDAFQYQFRFYRLNPRTSAAWGSEYDTTQFCTAVAT